MATYTVATPKGGVGKSTTAAELVLALSQRGRRVLAIDLDQQGNLTTRMGLTASSEVDGTTADVLALAREIRDGVRERFGIILVPEVNLVGVSI